MEGWTPALENLGKESDWIGGTEPRWVQERDWLKGRPNSSPEKNRKWVGLFEWHLAHYQE